MPLLAHYQGLQQYFNSFYVTVLANTDYMHSVCCKYTRFGVWGLMDTCMYKRLHVHVQEVVCHMPLTTMFTVVQIEQCHIVIN